MEKQANSGYRHSAALDAAEIEADLTELTDLLNREKNGVGLYDDKDGSGLRHGYARNDADTAHEVLQVRYDHLREKFDAVSALRDGMARRIQQLETQLQAIQKQALPDRIVALGQHLEAVPAQATIRQVRNIKYLVETKINAPLHKITWRSYRNNKLRAASLGIGILVGYVLAFVVAIILISIVGDLGGKLWTAWQAKTNQAATVQAPPAPPPQDEGKTPISLRVDNRVNNLWKPPRRE